MGNLELPMGIVVFHFGRQNGRAVVFRRERRFSRGASTFLKSKDSPMR